MDGVEVTRHIRESHINSELPIIAVTDYGASCYQSAMKAGCNEVIAKPLDFNRLKSLLNNYLSQ